MYVLGTMKLCGGYSGVDEARPCSRHGHPLFGKPPCIMNGTLHFVSIYAHQGLLFAGSHKFNRKYYLF